MRFLADENIAPFIVKALRQAGHDVIDIKEKKWHGLADKKLIDLAYKDKRIILTHDKDFIWQNRVSVILIRFYNQRPSHVIKFLSAFLSSKKVKKLEKTISIVVLSEEVATYRLPG